MDHAIDLPTEFVANQPVNRLIPCRLAWPSKVRLLAELSRTVGRRLWSKQVAGPVRRLGERGQVNGSFYIVPTGAGVSVNEALGAARRASIRLGTQESAKTVSEYKSLN